MAHGIGEDQAHRYALLAAVHVHHFLAEKPGAHHRGKLGLGQAELPAPLVEFVAVLQLARVHVLAGVSYTGQPRQIGANTVRLSAQHVHVSPDHADLDIGPGRSTLGP